MESIVKTVCQMCYFNCGIDVHVADGVIRKIYGMEEHPVSRGRICAKGIASQQLVTDPNRLRYPMRRVGARGGGHWERISWDEALDEIASRLRRTCETDGPAAVGYYRGQAPGWVTNYNYVFRFMNVLGSPNVITHANLCFAPRAIAHAATYGGFPEPDYERTNCIFLVGYNPAYTSPVNYAARIIDAKARGAKLIVVDPRFTNTAAKADLFLQPRPGTDAALLLGMMNVIISEKLYDHDFVANWTSGFEELAEHVAPCTPDWAAEITGVPFAKIINAALMLATLKPAVVVDGNGLDQHTNVVQTVRTTTTLRTLIGSVDAPGGSVSVPPLPFVDVQLRGRLPEGALSRSIMQYPLYYEQSHAMTGPEMTDAVSRGWPNPLRALIVQGGDPVAVLSETPKVRESLQSADFMVAHDLFPTATAAIADIVLPAASFLERDLILYYRYRPYCDGNLISAQNRAVEPVGESKSDLEFVFALARRLGMTDEFPWSSLDEAFDWELSPHGIDLEWLRAHPGGYERRYSPEELYRKYERRGFPTPSGKAELYSQRFQQAGYEPLPQFEEPAASPRTRSDLLARYPLVGSTGLKLGIHTHTQFRTLPWIRAIEPDAFVEIHPDTAQARQIEDGDMVLLESPQGTAKLKARITSSVTPGVVMATHGWGEPYAGGPLINDVTAEQPRDTISGATGNRSFLCEIRKIERA